MLLEKNPEGSLENKEILNQSILREINPEYSLEGLMLNLKLQYFGHLMQTVDHWRSPCCWERLRTKGEEGVRG